MSDTEPQQDLEALREFLAARDIPCPGCGYNLRGLTTGRCPECNHQLQLSVVLQDPHVGALLSTLIPLTTVSGTAAFVVAGTLLIIMRAGPPPRELAFALIWIPIGVLLVFGPPSVWLALPRGRAWFRRQTRPFRSTLRRCSWIATGLCFLAYIVFWMVLVF